MGRQYQPLGTPTQFPGEELVGIAETLAGTRPQARAKQQIEELSKTYSLEDIIKFAPSMWALSQGQQVPIMPEVSVVPGVAPEGWQPEPVGAYKPKRLFGKMPPTPTMEGAIPKEAKKLGEEMVLPEALTGLAGLPATPQLQLGALQQVGRLAGADIAASARRATATTAAAKVTDKQLDATIDNIRQAMLAMVKADITGGYQAKQEEGYLYLEVLMQVLLNRQIFKATGEPVERLIPKIEQKRGVDSIGAKRKDIKGIEWEVDKINPDGSPHWKKVEKVK